MTLRKVYQRAVVLPLDGLDDFWLVSNGDVLNAIGGLGGQGGGRQQPGRRCIIRHPRCPEDLPVVDWLCGVW